MNTPAVKLLARRLDLPDVGKCRIRLPIFFFFSAVVLLFRLLHSFMDT